MPRKPVSQSAWANSINDVVAKLPKRLRCNQCEATMINGVFCHETGCPNTNSRWDEQSGEWIKQRKCFDCGCTVDADAECCTDEPFDADQD